MIGGIGDGTPDGIADGRWTASHDGQCAGVASGLRVAGASDVADLEMLYPITFNGHIEQ
ncbi:Uncharacterised protein [Mycobacteroides abscessus]|uniref:Uncharacterized protein n=1 Tax=Mycobacteroides abscessus 1948 TaxID=1299323 RepID=A0A829QGI1_9MYCO|nr:hypothetical protein I542_1505 [Mycobacteroides abscessus 1948]CPU61645.1 Uncharacterised protein [Mycobacteroides abscessus]